MLWLLAALLAVCASHLLPHPDHVAWQPHQFTSGPIVIPGVTFPPGFPFPITYPLPPSFPYTPVAYQNILPSLVSQFNAALVSASNNIAAATAAVLANFAPNYSKLRMNNRIHL